MNKRFGYQGSGYRDELYTTPLNENEVSEETRKKARKYEFEFKSKGGQSDKLGWRNEFEDDHEKLNV